MVWDKITGALSSAGSSISDGASAVGDMITGEDKKKKKKDAALAKGKKAIDSPETFDPFQFDRDQKAAKESGDKNAMRELGMSEVEAEKYGKEEGSDWTSALGEAAKFLSANRKEKPKPSTPSLGSRNVNFDAGSFYGALNAKQAAFNNFGLK